VIEPVHTIKDVLGHPQLEARAYWQELEHAELGTRVIYPGGFCRLSDTFCKQWRRAPLIGEHNMEIYQSEMGFSEERLNHFKQAGII
jgi:crotonobetainyl-CoA:carnitine CoA-transferase CaiB-like acyl-CoA transferase